MSRAASSLPAASKSAREENFPVASLLLPAHCRTTVMCYYHFARQSDDIADSPEMSAEQKVAALDALDGALRGQGDETPAVATAWAYRRAVSGDLALIDTAAELLNAFRRDAIRNFCADWADLMGYCQSSAAPVGRFLLTLHGESPATFAASDALCAALQVLNHLQDCGKDLIELDRVYVPLDMLTAAGLDREVLRGSATPPALRGVLDRLLDLTDVLIAQARPLVGQVRDWRLRLQTAITVRVAERLSVRLRHSDPLAGRVVLSPLDYAGVVAVGIARGLVRPV